jgi:hypothetical protein
MGGFTCDPFHAQIDIRAFVGMDVAAGALRVGSVSVIRVLYGGVMVHHITRVACQMFAFSSIAQLSGKPFYFRSEAMYIISRARGPQD